MATLIHRPEYARYDFGPEHPFTPARLEMLLDLLAALGVAQTPEAGPQATREEILKYMDGKIAKWWMPDDVAFVEGIPHTATGKILKTALRDQFKDYRFPNAAA